MTAFAARLDRWAWWQQRTPRERVILAVGTTIVVLACTWTLLLAPVLATVAQSPQHRAERARQLATATNDLAALRKATPAAPARGDARAAVERALRERNLLAAGSQIDVQDGRVSVTLPAVALSDLLPALAALERSEGLRVVGATLTPRADVGVRAELALGR